MIPFIGEHSPDQSRALSSNLLINCYTETSADKNAKSKFCAKGREGTKLWLDMGDLGDVRGSHKTATGVLYMVCGSSIIRVDSDKTFEVVSSISDLSTTVSMADNGYYLLLADGTNLWALNLTTNVLQEVGAESFKNPTFVDYMDQRFVAINSDPSNDYLTDDVPNNNKIFFSEVGPEGCLTWFNTSFFNSESSADANTAMKIVSDALWVFGQRSIEMYQTDDNPDAPYAKIGGVRNEIGCLAPYSVATIGGSVFWLGSSTSGNNQIYMSQNFTPTVISNPSISYQLDEMGDTSDAVASVFQLNGHTYYQITFIGGNKTFRYDVGENVWARITTREQRTNVENRYAVTFVTAVYSTLLCGISSTENVGSLIVELDPNKYDDWDGRPIINLCQGPHMWSNLKKVFMPMIKIDMQVGLVPQNGQGSKPKLSVAIAGEGYDFNDYVRTIDLPLIGQYAGQVVLSRLGSGYSPVIRITNSDPIPFVLMGVDLKAELSNGY